MSEEERILWESVVGGSERAFQMLFDQHYLRLVNIAYKIISDLDQSRECAQDVMVRLYEKRNSIEIRTSLSSYLNRSVINAALNLKSKAQGTIALPQDDTLPLADEHLDLLESAEEEARIWTAIEALPEQCRRIFLMNRFEGLTNDQIAGELNISKRTVETQISNALKKLKNKLLVFWVLGF